MVTKRDDAIKRIFLDPTGCHLIVSTEGFDNYYVHINKDTPRVLTKLKNIEICSVGWDIENRDKYSTKEIIIGTGDGKIYNLSIDSSSEKPADKELPLKLLFTLDTQMEISGLYWERTGRTPTSLFVIITTRNRIYQFVGDETLEQLFASYDAYSEFQEIPDGRIMHNDLAVCRKNGKAENFAWLTGPGIFHGSVCFDAEGGKMLNDAELLYYSSSELVSGEVTTENSLPISLCLSPYYFLLLYPNRVMCVSTISKQCMFEQELPQSAGVPRRIARDGRTGTVLIATDRAVLELVISREDADVWSLLLDKKDWNGAVTMCKGDQQKLNTVYITQAEELFEQKRYKEAALCFAKTILIVDHVALRFYFANQMDALVLYASEKLKRIPRKFQTQITCLAMWLAEIYIGKIARLIKEAKFKKEKLDELEHARTDFFTFITNFKDVLEQKVVFDLLWTHGLVDEMIHYSEMIGKFERVIVHYLQIGDYASTVATLSKLPQQQEELFYRFSPLLVTHCIDSLVDCWIKVSYLNPKRLFPAFVRYELNATKSEGESPIIRYLEHCIRRGNRDVVIHNYLLSLLAQHCTDDEKLAIFVKSPNACYDPNYGLRVCTLFDRQRACVDLYAILQLYDEAVNLALRVDPDLAVKTIEDANLDEGSRKKLWLKVAQHVVKEKKDIKAAMESLRRSGCLKLEDVLPFFPDFTVIDDFREEVSCFFIIHIFFSFLFPPNCYLLILKRG